LEPHAHQVCCSWPWLRKTCVRASANYLCQSMHCLQLLSSWQVVQYGTSIAHVAGRLWGVVPSVLLCMLAFCFKELSKWKMHAGTSLLIEDVACPIDKLPDMMVDLKALFEKHGYDDASIFGHALEGNLHLVFSQVRNASDAAFWAHKQTLGTCW
jgi:FAD linked oxidases, C-terminal domain